MSYIRRGRKIIAPDTVHPFNARFDAMKKFGEVFCLVTPAGCDPERTKSGVGITKKSKMHPVTVAYKSPRKQIFKEA